MFRSQQRSGVLREVRVVSSAPGGLLCTINVTYGGHNRRNNRCRNDRFTSNTKTIRPRCQICPYCKNFKNNGKRAGMNAGSGDSEEKNLCEIFENCCRISNAE